MEDAEKKQVFIEDAEKKRVLKQALIDEIEADGLVGPWSWSSQLDHISTIVAYGVLRRNDGPEYYEEIVDGILAYVKKQALYIVSKPAAEGN